MWIKERQKHGRKLTNLTMEALTGMQSPTALTHPWGHYWGHTTARHTPECTCLSSHSQVGLAEACPHSLNGSGTQMELYEIMEHGCVHRGRHTHTHTTLHKDVQVFARPHTCKNKCTHAHTRRPNACRYERPRSILHVSWPRYSTTITQKT